MGTEGDCPVERTADGRYIVVDGRRWRASDPDIPEQLRTQLVGELMAARRAVGQATGAEPATSAARSRVQDAKVALGERGTPWWNRPEPLDTRRAHAAARTLLRRRADDATICPSEVARTVASPGWRDRMDAVRMALEDLVQSGELELRRGGRPVEPGSPGCGPVRYGRGTAFPAPPEH